LQSQITRDRLARMSRVQIGETARLVTADGTTQQVTVEHLFQRRGRDLASVRFADSHCEIVEAKNLNPEPPHPPTDAEVHAANRALDALALELQPPPKDKKESSNGRNTQFRGTVDDILKALSWPVAIVATIALFAALYEWVDSTGWIPHREETTISAESSWMVGESKECVS
jgi:hypothetical protein